MDEVQVELATATPPLFEIIFRSDGLNAQEVIVAIRECIEGNKQIRLVLQFGSFNDSTSEMQNTIFENLIHIKSLKFENHCLWNNGENRRYFNIFTRIVQESNGAIQHFDYAQRYNIRNHFNRLSTAIRSNKNGSIESFKVDIGFSLNIVLFQSLWNALLDTGIQKVDLCVDRLDMDDDNRNLFIRLSTNKSLRELTFNASHMLQRDWRDLFNSIKSNTGLQKLTLPQFHNGVFNDNEGKLLIMTMLRMNTSLIDVIIANYHSPDLQIEIKTETDLNRMWKQCTTEDKKEGTQVSIDGAASATAASVNHDNNKNDIIHDNDVAAIVVSDIKREQQQQQQKKKAKEKEEERKKFKMRVLLYVALNKPVLRDTIIFQLLCDYPDVFLCDNNNDGGESSDEEENDHHTVANNCSRRLVRSVLLPPTDTSVALPRLPVAVTVSAAVMELSIDLQAATKLNSELHAIIAGKDQVVEDRDATITVLQEEIENLRLMYDNLKQSMTQTIQDN